MSDTPLHRLIDGRSDPVPEVPTGLRLLRHVGYVIESRGSWLRAETRGIAVVLTVSGRVDSENVGLLGGNLARFVGLREPLVVVMDSEIEEPCGQVLLKTLNDECRRVHVAWAVIGYSGAGAVQLPLADSVATATRHFFDEVRRVQIQAASAEQPATCARVAEPTAPAPVGRVSLARTAVSGGIRPRDVPR